MAEVIAGAIITELAIKSTILAAAVNIAVGLAVSVGFSMLSRALFRPSTPRMESGITLSYPGPIDPNEVVYGRVVKGGTITYWETTGGSNGFLYVIFTIADHECDAIEAVWFDDKAVTTDAQGRVVESPYSDGGNHRAWYWVRLGGPTQTAVEAFVSEVPGWTSAHRGRGRCYVAAKFRWDSTTFPAGRPNVKVRLRGRKVYDPRVGGQNPANPATWAWSRNAVLCRLDYLRGCPMVTSRGVERLYGAQVADDEIDWDAVIAAANAADEAIPIAAGGTEPRYCLDGVVSTETAPALALEDMTTADTGQTVFTAGRWRLRAGVVETPTVELTADDLRGPIRWAGKQSRRDRFNAVAGRAYLDIYDGEPGDYPQVTVAPYVAEDGGGEPVVEQMDQPYTRTPSQAQRNARRTIERMRREVTATLPVKLQGIRAPTGTTIMVTLERYGWAAKWFEVVDWQLEMYDEQGVPALGCTLRVREIDAGVDDWSIDDETPTEHAPSTNLTSGLEVAPPTGVTLSSGTGHLQLMPSGDIISRILVAWTPPEEAFVLSGGRIEVRWRPQAEPDWQQASLPGDRESYYIGPVDDGRTYVVQLRAVNVAGVATDWQSHTHLVLGKSEPPSDVPWLTATQNGNVVNFRWGGITDADRAGYTLKYVPIGSEATAWAGWLLISEETKGTYVSNGALPPGSWTVGIKARDTSGNESVTITMATVQVINLAGHTFTLEGAPRWAGELVDMVRHNVSGTLVPRSTITAQASGTRWRTEFVPDPVAACSYETPELDIGVDNTVRAFTERAARVGSPDDVGPIALEIELDHRLAAGSYDGFEPWPGTQAVTARYLKARVALAPTAGTVGVVEQFDLFAAPLEAVALPPVEVVLTDTAADPSNLATYTFTDVDVGEPHPDRVIVIVAASSGGAAGGIVSAKVDAVDVDQIVNVIGAHLATRADFAIMRMPEGDLVDVEVEWPVTRSRCGIAVYRTLYVQDTAPIDTLVTGGAIGGAEGGLLLAAAHYGDNDDAIYLSTAHHVFAAGARNVAGAVDGSSYVWTGATKDADLVVETGTGASTANNRAFISLR